MTYVGVDGCPGGWFAVWGDGEQDPKCGIFENAEALWEKFKGADLVLIDMPIGLPSEGRKGDRPCDKEARRKLGKKRASSVFPAPCREAISKSAYKDACKANKDILGTKLSVFCWGICPKIKQLDDLLAKHSKAVGVIREAHPEICFWALAGERAMEFNKKTKDGHKERLAVFSKHWAGAETFTKKVLKEYLRKVVAVDDVLDAMAMYVTARMPTDRLATIPEEPELDERELPMEMVYGRKRQAPTISLSVSTDPSDKKAKQVNGLVGLVESLSSMHPELDKSGFAHVANVGRLEVESPYEISEGIRIRKAKANEVATLQILLTIMRPVSFIRPSRIPYETRVVSKETEPRSVSYKTHALPEQEWRYHVIEFEGSNSRLNDFERSTILTKTRLQTGPTVMAAEGMGHTFLGGADIGRFWEECDLTDKPFSSLGLAELDDLKDVYRQVSAFSNDRVNLLDAVKRVQQLDAIPKSSSLRFLGYVSVLESLITHPPDPKDPYDSLTRQVRQKMMLIGNRSKIPIPYHLFDSGTKPEKLWTKLYEYRSKIAHGSSPDFKGGLQCLRNHDTALEFVSMATVAVMRQALEEPDLIADLREC